MKEATTMSALAAVLCLLLVGASAHMGPHDDQPPFVSAPAAQPPQQPGFAPLPGDLQPEVAYFDAATGVSLSSEAEVESWADAGVSAPTASNNLAFTGSCRLYTGDDGAAAISFDGSTCIGVNRNPLPSTWDSTATGAFTAIWIGVFREGTTTADQMLMTLSRTSSDFDNQFIWSSSERLIFSNAAGYAYSASQGSSSPDLTLPPSGRWTLEAFVRHPGGTSVSYHRYGNDGPYLENWQATAAPSEIYPDTFAVGADPRDGNRFFDGRVAVVLLYNRALSPDSLLGIASFYAQRFKWSTPQRRTAAAFVYSNPAVTGSLTAVSNIVKLLDKYGISAATSETAPSPIPTSLDAFIIYASDGNNYLNSYTAGLDGLGDWVRAGGSLVLINGASGNAANIFIPLIDAIRGSFSFCTPIVFAPGERLVNRAFLTGAFFFIENKAVIVDQSTQVPGLACPAGSGRQIFGIKDRGVERSAAVMWGVGAGAIVWVGADFSVPGIKSIMSVVAGGVNAAAEFHPSPPPPLPPPPPYRKPSKKTRSPPPSPPPPPPTSPSPPPPDQGGRRRKPPPPRPQLPSSTPTGHKDFKKRPPPPPTDYKWDYDYTSPPPPKKGRN